METKFDEANYVILQQVNEVFKNGEKFIKVIPADTDNFVLLYNKYVVKGWWDAEVYMQGFNNDTTLISVKKMLKKQKDIIPSLGAVHSLFGCNTVQKMFGIRKGKAFSVVKRCPLNFLGRADSDVDDYIQEGKQFIAQCYGMKETISSKNRVTYLESVENVYHKNFQGRCQLSNIRSFPEKQPWKLGFGSLIMNVIRRAH